MKTIIKIQCTVLIGVTLFFVSCEKELFEIPRTTHEEVETVIKSTEAEAFQQKTTSQFFFDVTVTDCSRSGKTLEVVMALYEGFLFSWTIDGIYAGGKPQVFCVQSNSATITVTRKADGMSLSKTIHLFDGPDTPLAWDFDFELLVSHCIAGGAALEVHTGLPDKGFTYVWEIDGKLAGNKRALHCVCGKIAKVTANWIPTGSTLTKSAALPPCGSHK